MQARDAATRPVPATTDGAKTVPSQLAAMACTTRAESTRKGGTIRLNVSMELSSAAPWLPSLQPGVALARAAVEESRPAETGRRLCTHRAKHRPGRARHPRQRRQRRQPQLRLSRPLLRHRRNLLRCGCRRLTRGLATCGRHALLLHRLLLRLHRRQPGGHPPAGDGGLHARGCGGVRPVASVVGAGA